MKFSICKACAIVGFLAIVMQGADIPMEGADHYVRLRIIKAAAYYALTDEELS